MGGKSGVKMQKRELSRKTREEIGKGESNDNSEIPDRGATSDIPGLPSGVVKVG